jgi:hypothetical protein
MGEGLKRAFAAARATRTPPPLADGYYWARHHDGTTFIVLREGPSWYTVGVEPPIINFDVRQIIMPVPRPDN